MFCSMLLIIVVILLQISRSYSALNETIAQSTLLCRTERRMYLPYDLFKLDVCARCYNYMSPASFKMKFRYNRRKGILLDPSSNFTYIPDPSNSSQVLLDSFLNEEMANKWKACCNAAFKCCYKMTKEPLPTAEDGVYCPRTWDGWQCWPDTVAGETATQPCSDYIYFETIPPSCKRYAYKQCLSNGSWYVNENFTEWTNYLKCGRRLENRRYLHFHIAMYAISIITIVPALFIFMSYKQLQVRRITMHKNLFLSLMLQEIAVVLFKSTVILQELGRNLQHASILEANGFGCKILLVLTKYFRMTNYLWMFCEGYYLHKLIASAFADQKSLLMFYIVGWGLPVLPVSAYAIIRTAVKNEKCWAHPVEEYEWIINVPNLLSLLINLLFLCNIIRVLVTKLRATHANEPSQFRKAVRATLVLIPLFGLHFCLVIYRPKWASRKCGFIEAYVYFNYAMDGLQGFMVALIFCYMNGEVLYLLKRSYQRFKLQLQIQGSMHGNSILRRLSTTQDSTMNDSQNHHHSHRTKYMENKLREINQQINNKNIMNENNQKNYLNMT